jgi:hypothetical protein
MAHMRETYALAGIGPGAENALDVRVDQVS